MIFPKNSLFEYYSIPFGAYLIYEYLSLGYIYILKKKKIGRRAWAEASKSERVQPQNPQKFVALNKCREDFQENILRI